jgi:acyl-CoA thioester hydrolase
VENPGLEVWRGGVNTWECDRMGHLNVRFHVAHACEGLVGLAAGLGMPRAFAPSGASTLLVREHHVRFLREARPTDSLTMTAGVLDLGDSDGWLHQLNRHDDGAPAAAFRTHVEHVTSEEGRPFPWPERIRARAESLMVQADPKAGPRSLEPGGPMAGASLERADAAGLSCIARGAILVQDCDVFGRMRPEMFIGRISDGYSAYAHSLRKVIEDSGVDAERIGTAAVEFRLRYLDWPRAGDRVELRSGVIEVGERTNTLIHWLLDPETGRPWGQAEQVVLPFDLAERKMIALPQAVRERLQARTVKV